MRNLLVAVAVGCLMLVACTDEFDPAESNVIGEWDINVSIGDISQACPGMSASLWAIVDSDWETKSVQVFAGGGDDELIAIERDRAEILLAYPDGDAYEVELRDDGDDNNGSHAGASVAWTPASGCAEARPMTVTGVQHIRYD